MVSDGMGRGYGAGIHDRYRMPGDDTGDVGVRPHVRFSPPDEFPTACMWPPAEL